MRPILDIKLMHLAMKIILVKLKIMKQGRFENQDTVGQIENYETGKAVFSNDQDDENTESNRNSVIHNFMPRVISDDEILENINYLNSRQYDVIHNWTKECAI